MSHAQLVQQVYTYTRDTLNAFKAEDATPDMVEVGNEITNGMMWPDGGPLRKSDRWPNLADLLKAGIRAVHDGDAAGHIRTMIHIDKRWK